MSSIKSASRLANLSQCRYSTNTSTIRFKSPLNSVLQRHSPIQTNPRHGARHFHVPGPIEYTIQATETALQSFHTFVGLPWYLTIPAIGVVFSLIFRAPFNIHTRGHLLTLRRLDPLIKTWQLKHGLTTRIRKELHRKDTETTKRIRISWGVQRWKALLPILNVPPWLLTSIAFRRICLTDGGRGQAGTADSTAQAADATDWLEPPTEMTLGPESISSEILESANTGIGLSTGGALWFPDLTVADPYLGLPIIYASLFVMNFWPSDPHHRRQILGIEINPQPKERVPLGKWRVRLIRAFLCAAPLIPLVLGQLPSGIFLFWASSSATHQVMQIAIDKYYPLSAEPPFESQRCKNIEPMYLFGTKS